MCFCLSECVLVLWHLSVQFGAGHHKPRELLKQSACCTVEQVTFDSHGPLYLVIDLLWLYCVNLWYVSSHVLLQLFRLFPIYKFCVNLTNLSILSPLVCVVYILCAYMAIMMFRVLHVYFYCNQPISAVEMIFHPFLVGTLYSLVICLTCQFLYLILVFFHLLLTCLTFFLSNVHSKLYPI